MTSTRKDSLHPEMNHGPNVRDHNGFESCKLRTGLCKLHAAVIFYSKLRNLAIERVVRHCSEKPVCSFKATMWFSLGTTLPLTVRVRYDAVYYYRFSHATTPPLTHTLALLLSLSPLCSSDSLKARNLWSQESSLVRGGLPQHYEFHISCLLSVSEAYHLRSWEDFISVCLSKLT
ncbi:hypothetical protein J6590_099040 [Homalodisca vitripennis]|nr:hypothetical protein J6590_099040 [Homalodisca vitripennis]